MQHNTPQSNRGNTHGQALVPVILVMLIFTILALSFAGSASREIRASANYMHTVEKSLAAKGAVNYAMAALAQTSKNGATYGVVPPSGDTDSNGWRKMGDAFVKIEVIDTGAFLSLNSVDRAWLQRLPLFKDNNDLVTAIMDWKTKIDPSSNQGGDNKSEYYQSLPTPYQCKSAPFDSVEELLLVKGMSPQMLYGTLSGSPVQPGMATMSSGNSGGFGTTSSLRDGYTRQIPMTGFTPSTPSGGSPSGGNPNRPNSSGGNGNPNNSGNNPNNPNGQNNPSNQQDMQDFQEIFDRSQIPLIELLVPYATERNVASDGTARVNINTATEEDLTSKVGLTTEQAQAVIGQRNSNPNSNGNPSGNGGGNPPPPTDTPAPTPPPSGNPRPGGGNGFPGGRPRPGRPGRPGGFRSVFSTRQAPVGNGANPNSGGGTPNANGANGNGGNGNGDTSNQPSNPINNLSDMLALPGFTRALMQKIADKITFDDSPTRTGVINVNTAPSEVLATVSGMRRTVLDAIINFRQSGKAFQTIGDLFALQEMGRQDYQQLLPLLTTKSTTYLVRVKVRVAGQQGITAYSALVEMAEAGPRVVQWREVPRLPGWAYWVPPHQLPTPGTTESASAPDEPVSN